MNCQEIVEKLQSMSSEKYKKNVVKLGIPEQDSIGVSTGDVRKLAKTVGKSDALARELWKTGLHEAKLLAVLVYDKKTVSLKEAADLMDQVYSWDLCDHLCKNLLIQIPGYQDLIGDWRDSDRLYCRRAAFTLIASAAIHEKELSDSQADQYLQWIRECSDDGREHVKKAVSWALRELGKRDFDLQDKAVALARELADHGSKAQAWIGRDALKELENLVQAEGRGRLISTNTQMGRDAVR